jgi:hypothetical protein
MAATAPTIEGVTTITWGTPESVISGFIVESQGVNLTPDSKEYRDEKGNVITDVLYSQKREGTLEVLSTGGTAPAIGDGLTIDGVSGYYCVGVSKMFKLDDALKFTLTYKKHAAIAG